MPKHLLVIDDDPAIRRSLEYAFEGFGMQVSLAATAAEGLEIIRKEEPEVVVLDLFLPDMHGLEVLKQVRGRDQTAAVIVVTASDKLRDAVDAMKFGAMEYLVKPYDLEALKLLVTHAMQERRATLQRGANRKVESEKYSFEAMASRNSAMASALAVARKLAAQPKVTVLLEGETGVGKEFIARTIHNASPRADGAFVAISCAAIPETLLESELFGHEAGAFTDARSRKIGIFELAEGGTLFLDEVGEMSLAVQAKLLRAIETLSFRRVGGTEDLAVDTRIIAATNVVVDAAVKNRKFREDLFYRLKVGHIRIPPLRERPEDLMELSTRILREICVELKRPGPALEIGEEAARILVGYRWPGNVRELRNVLERVSILQEEGKALNPALLGREVETAGGGMLTSLKEMERAHILGVLERCKGNNTRAAKMLGISRTTLWEKLKQYKIGSGEQ